jgi:hypothetical protein
MAKEVDVYIAIYQQILTTEIKYVSDDSAKSAQGVRTYISTQELETILSEHNCGINEYAAQEQPNMCIGLLKNIGMDMIDPTFYY